MTLLDTIKITKTQNTKINDVDFDNLSFGSVFSDHYQRTSPA